MGDTFMGIYKYGDDRNDRDPDATRKVPITVIKVPRFTRTRLARRFAGFCAQKVVAYDDALAEFQAWIFSSPVFLLTVCSIILATAVVLGYAIFQKPIH